MDNECKLSIHTMSERANSTACCFGPEEEESGAKQELKECSLLDEEYRRSGLAIVEDGIFCRLRFVQHFLDTRSKRK